MMELGLAAQSGIFLLKKHDREKLTCLLVVAVLLCLFTFGSVGLNLCVISHIQLSPALFFAQFGWITNLGLLIMAGLSPRSGVECPDQPEAAAELQSGKNKDFLESFSSFIQRQSNAVRLILINLFTFSLIDGLFQNQGYLVGSWVLSPMIYEVIYWLVEMIVLYRLARPKGTQDLLLILLLVLGLPIGAHHQTLEVAVLAMIVFLFRWDRVMSLVGIAAFTVLRPIALLLPTILVGIHTFGPIYSEPARYSEIIYTGNPEPICNVDGIYKLVQNSGWLILYRDIEILPGTHLRKLIDERSDTDGLKPGIRRLDNGECRIYFREPREKVP